MSILTSLCLIWYGYLSTVHPIFMVIKLGIWSFLHSGTQISNLEVWHSAAILLPKHLHLNTFTIRNVPHWKKKKNITGNCKLESPPLESCLQGSRKLQVSVANTFPSIHLSITSHWLFVSIFTCFSSSQLWHFLLLVNLQWNFFCTKHFHRKCNFGSLTAFLCLSLQSRTTVRALRMTTKRGSKAWYKNTTRSNMEICRGVSHTQMTKQKKKSFLSKIPVQTMNQKQNHNNKGNRTKL